MFPLQVNDFPQNRSASKLQHPHEAYFDNNGNIKRCMFVNSKGHQLEMINLQENVYNPKNFANYPRPVSFTPSSILRLQSVPEPFWMGTMAHQYCVNANFEIIHRLAIGLTTMVGLQLGLTQTTPRKPVMIHGKATRPVSGARQVLCKDQGLTVTAATAR